jgi:hypothetical protein
MQTVVLGDQFVSACACAVLGDAPRGRWLGRICALTPACRRTRLPPARTLCDSSCSMAGPSRANAATCESFTAGW